MSRDKDSRDFREFEHSMEKIQERKKIIEREEKQIIVKCSHQNHRRKLKIRPISDHGDYRCKDCGTEFNMNPVPQGEVKNAIRVLHDVIQQIRCFADPEEDGKMIRLLGESDFNNEEILRLYARTLDTFGKNKKKDKFMDRDHDNSFGSYGTDSISFISGGKKHRK